MSWSGLRVAKGYEVKVMSREGSVFKFDGFKELVRQFSIRNYRSRGWVVI